MEQFTSQTSANETSKQNSSNETLIEQREIDNVWTAVRTGDKWHLIIGNYKFVTNLESYEDCVRESENQSWDRLLSVMLMIAEKVYEHKKLEETIERQKAEK